MANLISIEDYIFYRVWLAYKKANRFETHDTIIYLTVLRSLQIMPLVELIIVILFGYLNKLWWILILLVNVFFVARKYTKAHRESILKKYAKSKYNEIIPTWFFFAISAIYTVWALGALIILTKYVLNPYSLKGILL